MIYRKTVKILWQFQLIPASFQGAGGTLKIKALTEFIQRKNGRYLLISGCLASNPFLTATYFLLVSSLFHTTCSFGGRIVLGIYLCFQKQTGATASLPYPVKSEGVRPWPNPGQSDPLDLEKMSQGCQAVWHPPTCIPAHMFLWHNVQAPPPRGGGSVFLCLELGRLSWVNRKW